MHHVSTSRRCSIRFAQTPGLRSGMDSERRAHSQEIFKIFTSSSSLVV